MIVPRGPFCRDSTRANLIATEVEPVPPDPETPEVAKGSNGSTTPRRHRGNASNAAAGEDSVGEHHGPHHAPELTKEEAGGVR